MKSKFVLFSFLLAFNASNVFGQQSSTAISESSSSGMESQYEEADRVAEKLSDIKSASLNYYTSTDGWPSAISNLVSDGYYFGSFSTTFGTDISGAIGTDSRSYILTIVAPNESIASYLSAMVNGSYSGTLVTLRYGIPSSAAVVGAMLSRVFDASGTLNTMETNVLMAGYDLINVGNVDSNTVNASGGVYDHGSLVFSPYNLPTKSDVGLSNVENYGISNSYTGGASSLYASQKAVTDAYNALNAAKLGATSKAVDSDKLDGYDSSNFVFTSRKINGYSLTSDLSLSKSDIGLGNVQNYSITNDYRGGNAGLYASQKSVTDAYNSLNSAKLGVSSKAKDSDKLDGLDSTAFVRTTRKINGKSLSSDITLSKSDIGLSNVPNYTASNSYTGNSTTVFATQRAVNSAYVALTNSINNKLDKTGKAADSDKLDGLDSSAFVRTTRKINGRALSSDISITKSDVGLGNVSNYGTTNSYTGRSTALNVSQRALNDAYNNLDDKISSITSGDEDRTALYYNSGGLDNGNIFLSSSWRGYDEIMVIAGDDGVQREIEAIRFTEADYDLAVQIRGTNVIQYNVGGKADNWWLGYFSSDTRFTTLKEQGRIHAIYGIKRS